MMICQGMTQLYYIINCEIFLLFFIAKDNCCFASKIQTHHTKEHRTAATECKVVQLQSKYLVVCRLRYVLFVCYSSAEPGRPNACLEVGLNG